MSHVAPAAILEPSSGTRVAPKKSAIACFICSGNETSHNERANGNGAVRPFCGSGRKKGCSSIVACGLIIYLKGLSLAITHHLTEDLLARLLASTVIDEYLKGFDIADRALSDYLNELLQSHGIKRADVVRGSGINATVVYDIFAGKSNPGRDHAIMLAFGLKCDVVETQRLLRMAGVSELWCKIRRDAIILWCIQQGFDRAETDDELYRFGEKTLLATGRLR